MSSNINQAIRIAYQTGKVTLGTERTIDIVIKGKAKLVVLAQNSPKDFKKEIDRVTKLSEVPVIIFKGSSYDLGSACGKPFMVNALAVQKEGNSNILDLVGGS
ncbi:MAG: 50S ribosomal protein L30e [Candidatus Ranarchaeia archaeon]|jgi:large subunit ribosomal protein L30e